MKVAIMQPYFFPYLGYFQLINSVNKYVFYDDVQYVRRGWMKRNRILNRETHDHWEYVGLKVVKNKRSASINEIILFNEKKQRELVLNRIQQLYSSATHLSENFPILKEAMSIKTKNLAEYNIKSTKKLCSYFGIDTKFYVSSELHSSKKGEPSERLIEIVKNLNGTEYINAIGGKELYSKQAFAKEGIDLKFIKMNKHTYPQGSGPFVSGLSIIDVLMWNSKHNIAKLLNNYSL